MKTAHDPGLESERGFTLIEILVATVITLLVMASVFTLLQKGQRSFQREPEVADMNQAARMGLDMISSDLGNAGFNTPPPLAVVWSDGGGDTPDELTIVFADPAYPTAKPLPCTKGSARAVPESAPTLADLGNVWDLLRVTAAPPWRQPFQTHVSASFWSFLPLFFSSAQGGGPCGTIENSSTIYIDASTGFEPPQSDPTTAYKKGMVLTALEFKNCDGNGNEKNADPLGIIPFEVTQDPVDAGGKININHNPGSGTSEFNQPKGFNGAVTPECAVIGFFRVIQYRIRPLPPAANPTLQRRDVSMGEDWGPVARNIENLQVQYSVGTTNNFVDVPATPDFDDPATWITQVRVRLDGTSETTDLEGASEGVFADGNRLRRTFATTVTLRNQMTGGAYN
jgi:prepilin-type N-terminal cleavage/methylation domain-containing protein